MGGIEVCRALRDDPLFDHSTPIIVTSAGPAAHRASTAAYAAGAWEYCSQPIDVEALMLKLATFVRASRDVREARTSALLDPSTGLYSAKGLEHWARQLGARAIRNREPIACVAVRPQTAPDARLLASGEYASEEVTRDMLAHGALAEVMDLCREESRRSDVIGYLGDSRLAILAPDTDAVGAQRFVGRLARALETGMSGGGDKGRRTVGSLYAGYCAIDDLSSAGIEPVELLRRAELALAHSSAPLLERAATNFDDLTSN
jgi:PleD family two-component response regulator